MVMPLPFYRTGTGHDHVMMLTGATGTSIRSFISILSLRPHQRNARKIQAMAIGTVLTATVRSLSTTVTVVGGGASGIFAAIAAAEANPGLNVMVLEGSSKILSKVLLSGGGRCNVMHNSDLPANEILEKGYPRGRQELSGLLHKRFPPVYCRDWFESRGVPLKTEEDGRMFPVSDSSQTVLEALERSATEAGVKIQTRTIVKSIESTGPRFSLVCQTKNEKGSKEYSMESDALILATGSAQLGYRLASQSLGHSLVKPVPSLFTLSIAEIAKGQVLYGLAGVSVPHASVSFKLPVPVPKSKRKSKKSNASNMLQQEGPLLITHHGLSGPAALRLSAFGARDLFACQYKGQLYVHWAAGKARDTLQEELLQCTETHPKKLVATVCPLPGLHIPRRLWSVLVQAAGIPDNVTWAAISKAKIQALVEHVTYCPLTLTGKGTFKEEFVTAGGVSLSEIDMRTMESKLTPGLYFCGEVIDVDGVTGGFNFMNAWGTGFVAGSSAAAAALAESTLSD